MEGFNTKPANRVGPLRVSAPQEEGSSSSSRSTSRDLDDDMTRKHTEQNEDTARDQTLKQCSAGSKTPFVLTFDLFYRALLFSPFSRTLKLNAALFPRTSPVTCFDLTG